MLTEFGKALRKIRIEHEELLKDMATVLDVSPAYLSAVETGKRRIPDGWAEKISDHYHLPPHERIELTQAVENSAQEVRISLQDTSDTKREAVLTFAKALDQLSDEDLKRIMQSMKRGNQKRGGMRRD